MNRAVASEPAESAPATTRPTRPPPWPARLPRWLLEYAFAIAACAVAAVLLLRLWQADLAVPLWYDGDALFYGAVVKAIAENGWYLTNPRLGMPFGQELHDFPMPDSLSYGMVRALAFVLRGDAGLMNAFYLTCIPLTTLSTLWTVRRLGVSYAPALLAALLYTFTAHRLVFGQFHLMYTVYWTVPPMVLVLVRLATGELAVRRVRDLCRPAVLGSLTACAAIASTGGAYYPFFSCTLLVAVALTCAVRARRLRAALLPLGFAAFTFAVFVLNLLPCIVHRLQHGATATAMRGAHEADIFSLKLAQMLLPVAGHRVPALAAWRAAYDLRDLPAVGYPVALGFLGSLGFLTLLGVLLFARPRQGDDRKSKLLEPLSTLNAVALLFGLVGGLGGVFAFVVSPQLRGYAGVIVFLALFAFVTVAVSLDALRPAAGRARAVFGLGVVLLAALALFDQTPTRTCPDIAKTRAAWAHDRAFYAQVENAVPAGAMVFQWPRQEFPEGESYAHLAGYLHTRALRWSFGAMRGRRADLWQRRAAALPPAELIDTLAAAGFAGICFDRALANDADRVVADALVAHAGPVALTSTDGRLAFLSLAGARARIDASPDAARVRARALQPVLVTFGREFSAADSADPRVWHGCGARGTIVLDNCMPGPRRVRMRMVVLAPQRGTLALTGGPLAARIDLTRHPTPWTEELELPAGETRLQLRCDVPPLDLLPGQPPVAFGVSELDVHDVEDTPR